jgi:DNA ligase-associated metallophosphoesterase
MVPFSFAGETFVASPDGAVHWPAQNALLVADLHLEKASWFARLGQFLPPYDSVATLSALTQLADSTGVQKLYCLGDSFHDRFGCDRLPEQARALLRDMTNRIEWMWILGNHDPGFADHCGGTLVDESEIAGIILRHEANRDDRRPEISGHYHPKYRVNVRGRHVSRRCFVASRTKLILPAFGSLTGGLDASHPEIVKQVGVSASALVPLSDRMLRFPIAA